MKELFTLIDALFTVHPFMQNHTGGAMFMIYEMIHCCSSKQKLNKKIVTKSDLVVTIEYVPFNIWIVIFYEAQGYDIIKISYFNIMKVQLLWIRMDNIPAKGIQYTLPFDTSLLKIEKIDKKLSYNSVEHT